MKIFVFISRLLLIILLSGLVRSVEAQRMLDPTDPIVNYDSASKPVQPAWGKIGKWVRKPLMTWNTNAYKCYIYKGCDFRLHFPQTYKPGDGKKYPIMVFYHGNGEIGPIYDNELQLKNGGLLFHNAEVKGTFDGYIIMMQNQDGWSLTQYTSLHGLIDTLVQEYGGDPYRVVLNGLSGGGQAIYNEMVLDPTYFASAIPMSAALLQYSTPADVNILKFTPIWDLDGGLDNNPSPALAQSVARAFQSAGANYIYTDFTTRSHDTWDSTWLEPNFWPFVNNTYLSDPWPLFGRTIFCPSDKLDVTIGIVPGLGGYQWRMNGTVIPGATSDSLIVNEAGTYDARVLRGSVWSDWSHTPVQVLGPSSVPTITIKQPTCTLASGTIIISLPKGVGLTYSIDGATYQSDTSFANLAPGTYYVTVKNNAVECISSSSIAIINPQPPTPAAPNVTIIQPSCVEPTGTIFISAPVGPGLLYDIAGNFYQSDTTFANLAPGTYNVTVKNNAVECISSSSIAIINPQPLTPAAPTLTVSQPTCVKPTGTIFITAPVGPGLLYGIAGNFYKSDSSINNLAPGTYKITAKSDSGCVSSSTEVMILNKPVSCNIVISVYPNPYLSEVNFNIISPESGQGSLVFYNFLGERMKTIIERDFVAGISTSVTCPMNFAKGQPVIYQLSIGNKKYKGTLLPQKF